MISFDEAFEIVMTSAGRLGTERVSILDNGALNRVLAEDVASDIDMPPFNKSAMDGFACRRADLDNELTIIETISAGSQPQKTIGPNQCSRIMTGAVVPEGADCVIMVEYSETAGKNKIRFTPLESPGAERKQKAKNSLRGRAGGSTKDNICQKGEDVKSGDIVLHAGELIKPQHIAVLASVGCVEPLVSLQPRVGVIATGDELVEPGQRPTPCQIRNSNGLQLAAQIASAGAITTNYGIVRDTEQAINDMLNKAMAENDVVLLSGGVSVGDYDYVRGILRKNNVKLLFEKVAVKPGRPMVFGVAEEPARCYCFGLPGNPVSAFIMFELLIKPFLFKLTGHDFKAAVTHRQLEKTITRKKAERDSWLPVVFTGDGKVARLEYHGSAHINALSRADGLICVPAGTAQIKEGTTVAIRQI